MPRFSFLIPTLVTALLAAGCDKAIDDQNKANASQTEANDKIAAAQKEATQKTAAAQVEAEKGIAAATASFMRLRGLPPPDDDQPRGA